MKLNVKHITVIVILITGLALSLNGIYIYAKARLAQYLLREAWTETRDGKENVKPWSWADTHPVAKMTVVDSDEEFIVLEGCSGSSLAFGPGHMTGTPLPGEKGVSVISAHRDTHFRFLRNIKRGDLIKFETRSRSSQVFRVVETLITDKYDYDVLRSSAGESAVILVTCFPFDAVTPGGEKRFITKLQLTTE